MNRLLLVLPTLAFLTAAVSTAAAQKPKYDRYVISAEEIRGSGVTSAYEAIERLRPQFLRTLRSSGLADPYAYDPSARAPGVVLFLDDTREPQVEILKHIAAEAVQEIRYYRPTEAGGRLGVLDGSAAIVVTLKPRPH